jgi:capsule biosynthesis phosphatase
VRRIAIDLDGTICPIKQPNQSYADLKPLNGAVEGIRNLRSAGYVVLIVTARNMATCEGNVGKVMKNVGLLTLSWLAEHGVEYDEIYFGKPNADLYIDDRAMRFSSWADIQVETIEREARHR